jgi:hypothetical protein
MPWRTPPKCEAICLVQEKGASKAQAQGVHQAFGVMGLVPSAGGEGVLLVERKAQERVVQGNVLYRASNEILLLSRGKSAGL